MPRSSRHKSQKHSKHTSKDYSDSEEDVMMKDKSSRNENLVKVHRDSFSGEKRKISSHLREGKEGKDLVVHGNGEVSEEYFSSKRHKEKGNVAVDRWNGGGEEACNGARIAEKDTVKGHSSKIESRSKEFSNKGESLRIESKNKSKKLESGSVSEMKEGSSTSMRLENDEGKSKEESKKKSEDYSGRKEGKEFKDKDRWVEKQKEKEREREKEKDKDKSLGQDSKRYDAELKLMDTDFGKKHGSELGYLAEGRPVKKSRENTDCPILDELKIPESEKEIYKRLLRKTESSSNRGVRHDDLKESEEKGSSTRSDHAKDVKHRDDKHKDNDYSNKYHEDEHNNNGRRDEKYHGEIKKDNKHWDNKYGENGGKDARYRDGRHRGDNVKENRPKDEKNREGESDTKRKDEKYQDVINKEYRYRDYRYCEDGERDRKHRDDHYCEDGHKDGKYKDERYYEDSDRDYRRRENKYKEDGSRDNKKNEEKNREENERGSRLKYSKQGGDFESEKSMREGKYREELATGDHSGDKSDPRHSIDDGYTTDLQYRKSSAYDDSPTHDFQTVRYRDDQVRRRTDDREDQGDVRSLSTKDQIFDAEKRTVSGARMNLVSDRGLSTSRNAEFELHSNHRRRHGSPIFSSQVPRDNFRLPKQDEYRYRDYSNEERFRYNMTPSRDYTGNIGGSEKTPSSRSLQKLGQKEDGQVREFSPERLLISDIHSSPLKLLDKSQSSNTDRRQFSRSNVRPSVDIEELIQSGGSRDMEYYGDEVKESREFTMDGHPRDELPQADADTASMSSPFARNSHLSNSSKSYPPLPPLRSGVDSSLTSGSIEDNNRFKLSSRFRKNSDPNFGRIQGSAWRGIPSWPSPVANGFMSFPHAPPPVNFHSLMPPFPAPSVFGMRPSMDLNHHIPYHISDADRYSSPVRPMGWHHSVDDSRPPLHAWDASSAVFRDDSHVYERPEWNHSGNLPAGPGWDTTGDLWKMPSKNTSFEMPSYEKENNFTQNLDEARFIQPHQNEHIGIDQQSISTDTHQFTCDVEIKVAEASQTDFDTGDVAKFSNKNDMPLCHVYLSRLDISADLTEPELFNQCAGFIDVNQNIVSDGDDSKVLLIQEALEAQVTSHQILNHSLSTLSNDFVFQRAISLYKRQKYNSNKVVDEGRVVIGSHPIFESDQENLKDHENLKMEDKSPGKLPDNTSYLNCAEDDRSQSNVDIEFTPSNGCPEEEPCTKLANQKPDLPPANTMVKSETPVCTKDHVSTLLPNDHFVEEKLSSAERVEGLIAHSTATAKGTTGCNVEEPVLMDAKCGTLLNSDVCSEAMMQDLVASESVNLSRIHHSHESTH